MDNAFGQPQSVLVLGGTSDIARATLRRLVRARARVVVLAGRRPDALVGAADELRALGAERVEVVAMDALDVNGAETTVSAGFAAVGGPVDLVLLAVGELGDQFTDEDDAGRAGEMATVNFAWPVAALAAVRGRLVSQGCGRICVLSSVAAVRVRRNNYLYSGSKAGLDRLCEGLADSLIGTGVSLLIVRPGFVRSKMTEGKKEAPFAVGVEEVAEAIERALGDRRRVAYCPGLLRWVFLVMRHLPAPVWRKVAANQ